MKNLFKLFWEFDLYPYNPSLRVGDKEGQSTNFGQILTKFLCFLTLALFFSELSSSIKRSSPHVTFDSITQFNRPKIHLNQNNFKISFQIVDKYSSQLIDKNEFGKYFQFNVNAFIKNVVEIDNLIKTWNITTIPLAISNCDKKNFIDLESQFENRNLSNFYCVEKFDTVISGYIDEGDCNYIELELIKCKNTTINQNFCKSIEEIDEKAKDGIVYFYIQEAFADPNDYENPIKYSLKMGSIELSPNLIKTKKDFLMKMTLITDSSLTPFEDLKEETFFKYVSTETEFKELDQSNKLLSYMIFSLAGENSIHRSYNKIQYILSDVGGIANFLFILGLFLSLRMNKHEFNIKLMNMLFNFNNNDDSKEKKLELNATKTNNKNDIPKEKLINANLLSLKESSEVKEPITPKILKNILSKEAESLIQLNESNKNQISIEIKSFTDKKISYSKTFHEIKLKNSNKNDISFSFIDYLLSYLPKKMAPDANKKNHLFQTAKNKLFKRMEFSKILKKLDEIKKIKWLLLNENQRILFSFLSKPKINIKDEVSKEESIDKKLQNVILYYQNLNNSGFTDIDLKLFDSMDDNLKLLLKN